MPVLNPSTPKPPRDAAAPVDAASRAELFASVMANVQDAVLVTEAEPVTLAEGGPRIIYVNEAFTRMTGYTSEDAVGQTPRMLQSPLTDQRELDRLRRALRRWEPVQVELRNVHKDGTEFWVQFIIVPVADEDGWYTHWISVQRDVTERRRRDDELAAMVNGTTDVVTLVDPEGHVTAASPAAERALLHPGVPIAGRNVLDFLVPEQRDAGAAALREAARPGARPVAHPILLQTLEGPRWYEATARLAAADEQGASVVITAVDVTEQRAAQAALDRARRRFAGAFTDAPIGMAVISASGAFVQVNEQLCRLLGRDRADLLTLGLDDVVHAEDRGESKAERAEVFAGTLAVGRRESRLLHADGRTVGVMLSSSIVDREGEAVEVVVHVEDISERNALQERLTHQALHDVLTDLPNRALFLDRLATALRRAERLRSPVSVLFLDLDGFKRVNDELGHESGDRVLAAVAARVDALLRPSDTASRFGGDEFTILCEGADIVAASEVACRVSRAIEQPIWLPDHGEVRVRASIGIASTTSSATTADELLRDADMAMYAAKAGADVRFEVFDDRLRARTSERLDHERELRGAIERDELVLHYQPLFPAGVADGGPREFEALVRWEHPSRGLLAPGAFIPAAEDSGLIVELDHWVLQRACSDVARLGPGAKVWVNVAPRTLGQGGLEDRVGEALGAAGMPAARLGLEITERAVVEGGVETQSVIERLRSSGVAFAADDFGTGYSSLSALIERPMDVLKIDRSFVDDLPAPRSTAVVSAIVAMAAALGLRTVAEGVEREEQLEAVRGLGVDLVQGYLLARPVALAELEAGRSRRC